MTRKKAQQRELPLDETKPKQSIHPNFSQPIVFGKPVVIDAYRSLLFSELPDGSLSIETILTDMDEGKGYRSQRIRFTPEAIAKLVEFCFLWLGWSSYLRDESRLNHNYDIQGVSTGRITSDKSNITEVESKYDKFLPAIYRGIQELGKKLDKIHRLESPSDQPVGGKKK
jgi:hypothetical protein